jgi:hypothetical protein
LKKKKQIRGDHKKKKNKKKKLTLRTLETIDKIGCLNFFLEIVSLNALRTLAPHGSYELE